MEETKRLLELKIYENQYDQTKIKTKLNEMDIIQKKHIRNKTTISRRLDKIYQYIDTMVYNYLIDKLDDLESEKELLQKIIDVNTNH